MSPQLPYDLGCPVWASATWPGKLFRATAKRAEWLRQYSQCFSTVEGNSTFYGLPDASVITRWCKETESGFRFALKFPRSISHDCELVAAEVETKIFLDLLAILQKHNRLGPSLLQLGPSFSGNKFGQLVAYLQKLPPEFHYAVEVRHPDYFDDGPIERELESLLRAHGVDRVTMDTRALFSRPPSDAVEEESQRRKPRSPIRKSVTGQSPMLRLVGRNRIEEALPWIEEWTLQVAAWIRDGLRPIVFTHAPDDAFAPDLARLFHAHLRQLLPDLPQLPTWPAEIEKAEAARQQQLF